MLPPKKDGKVISVAAVIVAGALLASQMCGGWHWESGTSRVEIACAASQGRRGVACQLVNQRGHAPMQACWTFEVACANGMHSAAHACTPVRAGETVTHLLPEENFIPSLEACDQVTGGAVRDLAASVR
jgi:hypothetical protein